MSGLTTSLHFVHFGCERDTLPSSQFGQTSVSRRRKTFFPISAPHSGHVECNNLKSQTPQHEGQ